MLTRVKFTLLVAFSICLIGANSAWAQVLTLPTTPVTYYADGGDHVTGFFNVNLSEVPPGFSVSNGLYVGFCTSIFATSPTGNFHSALLLDSTSPSLPPVVESEPWDLINYILNHKIGTADEVQSAIWIVDEGISILPVTANVQQMVADAEANGHGFVPSNGQLVAVIVRATDDTSVQTIIIPVPTPPNGPCLHITKVADNAFVPIGQAASYTYVVTNCGGVALSNVVVVDDAGTPNDLSDDFTVATIPVLQPGQVEILHATAMLPMNLCTSTNSSTNAGTLTVEVLPSGDIKVVFRQSRSLNDNVYGTPAVADGWSKGHKFNDLVGSDEADFVFTDSHGKVVLNFQLDYISQSKLYPSGYGSLGVSGGDGKMIVGAASNILSYTTTLTDDLNQSPAFYGYTVNSPSPESAFPTWDYVDGYTVVVSKKAFGANGFGGVEIASVHNSPSKNGNDKITPVTCTGCITNTAFAGTNANGMLSIMSTDTATVCFGTPMPPALKLFKSASSTSVTNGQSVTYSYTIQNTGTVAINNITITDDNGTPSDTSDDFIVATIPTLGPLQSQTFTVTKVVNPPTGSQLLCATINGTNSVAGEIITTTLPSGDIQVTFNQSESLNDNRYGTGATAATGWTHGHKFNDLVGSDQAEFRFTDGNGKVVLDFESDYIGKSSAFPSGYGSLGATGGDGKLIVGSASDILSATTSLTENLKLPQFVSGFTVNSPHETSPLSDVSVPAGWNYTNSYTVVISKNAFGSAGFGGVTIPEVHNSPAKLGGGPVKPVSCNACVMNVATAVGTTADTQTMLSASSSAQVCFVECDLNVGAVTFGNPGPPPPHSNPHTVTVAISNNGSSPAVLSELHLTWPQAINGMLTGISLNGPNILQGHASSGVTLTAANFHNDPASITQRTIVPGQTLFLILQFDRNVSTNPSDYKGTANFGVCSIDIP